MVLARTNPGEVALITGAARRIGRALARTLAARGFAVAVHHRNSANEAAAVVREIEQAGGLARAFAADLDDVRAAEGLFAAVTGALGAPRVLIHNASRFERASLDETEPALLRRELALHVESPLALSRAFAAALPDGAEGRIVALLDWRASLPDPEYLPYTIAKSALLALVRNLAVELGPRVTVNGVAPGAILPPSGSGGKGLADLSADLPARRAGTVEDVVEACLFLIERAPYTTGAVIPVDGGRHLG
jgi:NAD(P)-dependent dehydrogenase (short-subunit alcohol dehydrogenase family)